MTDRAYQLLIWHSTATSPSTTHVAFTLGVNRLAEAPVVLGPTVRPLDGRIEGRPWSVEVVDVNSTFTSRLADANGRSVLLNRFVQLRRSDAGSTFTPIGGGRLVDAVNAGNIATWRLTIQDEWLAGADTLLFTTNTTKLYPPGAANNYRNGGVLMGPGQFLGTIQRSTSNAFRRYWKVTPKADVPPMNDAGFDVLGQDVLPTAIPYTTRGNFQHLRLRVDGTDYKVVSFRSTPGSGLFGSVGRPAQEGAVLPDPDQQRRHQEESQPLSFWVAASSTAFGGSGSKTLNSTNGACLHAFTAPASELTPLHLWQAASSVVSALHPMTLLLNILRGDYSSGTLPFYSTASFSGTNNLRQLGMPGQAFRITQPSRLKDWVEDHLCAPYGVVPFTDPTGVVRFRSVRLPSGTTGYDPATLKNFTSTNLTDPHPTWNTNRREQVTAIRTLYAVDNRYSGFSVKLPSGKFEARYPQTGRLGADGMAQTLGASTFLHDRITRFGRRDVEYLVDGVHLNNTLTQGGTVISPDPTEYAKFAAYIQREVFDRYGDGPVYGEFTSPGEFASTVRPGDFVALTLNTYPNLQGSVRGGVRAVQVLSRDVLPNGYRFSYLDMGSSFSPLAAPTLVLANSTRTPKHALRATIGNKVGSFWQLEVAKTTSTSAPGTTSSLWQPAPTTGSNTTGQFEVQPLPSGTKYYARARNTDYNKPRSLWTVSAGVATSSITSPSGLTASAVMAHSARSTWVNGDQGYYVDVHCDASTGNSLSTSNRIGRFPSGTQEFVLPGLNSNDSHRLWVRHADAYGGYSGSDSTTFTTLTTASTANVRQAPNLGGLYVLFGSG